MTLRARRGFGGRAPASNRQTEANHQPYPRDQLVMPAGCALNPQEVAVAKFFDPRLVDGSRRRRQVAVLFSDSPRRPWPLMIACGRGNYRHQRCMSEDFSTSVRLSAEHHAFHRRELVRLRALAATITTKAMKGRVLQQAEQHARLIGLGDDD